MKNILITIKDCETSIMTSPILEKALELVSDCPSKVYIIHVALPSRDPPYNVDHELFHSEISKELCRKQDFLIELEKYLQERNIDATARLIQGPIVRTILQQSEELDADMVLLGHQKRRTLFKTLVGDAIERLPAKSSRPILFIPV